MIDTTDISYYASLMAMGKRHRDRQPAMWVTTTDLPSAASHPFYRRLNQLLREYGFDDFVEAQCARCYAETIGRRGLPPRIYSGCCWSAISRALTPRAGPPARAFSLRSETRCVVGGGNDSDARRNGRADSPAA